MQKGTALLTASGALIGALLIGGSYGPKPDHPRTRAWYKSLKKPGYTPPKPTYGIVWGGIGTLLVLSGCRLLAAKPSRRRTRALTYWGVNVAGIGLWPKLFFGQRNLSASALVSGGMTLSAIAAAAAASRVDRLAGYASLPLPVWLSFATLLGEEIWRKNQ